MQTRRRGFRIRRMRRPLVRIVFGALEALPGEAARRDEHGAALRDAEQVICSCRMHQGQHDRAAVERADATGSSTLVLQRV